MDTILIIETIKNYLACYMDYDLYNHIYKEY